MKKKYLSPYYFTICDQSNQLITKRLNMLAWSLLSPRRWRIKSCWILCKTLYLVFSKMNFVLTGLFVLSSISRTLNNFYTGFFLMYRKILELKNHNSISRKNGLFANKTCCSLTALFAKTKTYFCRSNFGNKQINKNS